MFKVNLDIKYPSYFETELEKTRSKQSAQLIGQGLSKEEADKLIPKEYNNVEMTLDSLLSALNADFTKKYKQKGAPLNIRKSYAKITEKIYDVLDSKAKELELSDEQFDLCFDVLGGETSIATALVYVYEEFERLKLESTSKKVGDVLDSKDDK